MDDKQKKPVECKEKSKKSYRENAKDELIALRCKFDTKVKLHAHSNNEDSKDDCTSKRFYFIRHGEAEHNRLKKESKLECDCSTPAPSGNCPYANFHIVDPMLTELGREQARKLAPKTMLNDPPDIIYVSPLRRATETAMLAFPHLYPSTSSRKTKLPEWKCDE